MERHSSEWVERLQSVETAANVILEEIRSIPFDTDDYPPHSSTLFVGRKLKLVPEIFKVFLERLILKKKRKQ